MYKIQGGTNIKPLVTKILLRGIRLSIGNKNLINENHLIITKPAQKPVQKPVQKPAQKPVQKPVQKPAQKPAQKPVKKPAQKPAQKPDGRLRKKMNGGGSSEFFENI